jgi:hypothetical protein
MRSAAVRTTCQPPSSVRVSTRTCSQATRAGASSPPTPASLRRRATARRLFRLRSHGSPAAGAHRGDSYVRPWPRRGAGHADWKRRPWVDSKRDARACSPANDRSHRRGRSRRGHGLDCAGRVRLLAGARGERRLELHASRDRRVPARAFRGARAPLPPFVQPGARHRSAPRPRVPRARACRAPVCAGPRRDDLLDDLARAAGRAGERDAARRGGEHAPDRAQQLSDSTLARGARGRTRVPRPLSPAARTCARRASRQFVQAASHAR